MTMYYSPAEEYYLFQKRQEEILAEKLQSSGGVELFKCSDGNYRDAEGKRQFDGYRGLRT